MVTRLHGALRRELDIKGRAYVVTLDNDGIRLTLKGHRKGQELSWNDVLGSGGGSSTAWTPSAGE